MSSGFEHRQRPEDPLVMLVQHGRVGPAQDRVQEPAVLVGVHALRGGLVARAVRAHRVEVERDPDRRARRAQRVDRQPVREQQMVRDAERRRPVADARRLAADGVSEDRHHPRLVVRDPALDDVAELGRHVRRVVGEAQRGVTHRPAAGLLAGLREVPVVERRDGLDAALQAALDQPPIPRHAARVQRPAPVRLHPRPGDREAIGLDPQRCHQVEIGRPAVVVIAGHVAGVAVDHGARLVAEAVPDRLAAPVLAHGAFDLVGRGGRAEAEPRREPALAGRQGSGGRHPFTAPAVMPFTSQRCVAKKAMSTGRVETTPAAINWAVLSW